jgi:hypothetical protein
MIVIVRRNNGGTKPLERQNMIVISATGAYQNRPSPVIRAPLSESETYLRLAVDRPQP